MSLVVPWLVYPLVLALISLGCGLLVETCAGRRLPGPLLLPTGLALIVVAAGLATETGGTARFATPLVLALAALGFVTSRRLVAWRTLVTRRLRGVDAWPAAAAVGVFSVFGAPIVLSGQATFAGYIKLDDTASFLAMTDRVMDHGRDLSGLAPSTYEAVLYFNLGKGYPIGSLLPLGVGAKLVGQDPAWLFQPCMAFFAAMLALAIYSLLDPLVRSRRLRAVAAFVAAQSALLYGYSLWGGIKELAAAAVLAVCAALAAREPALTRAGLVPLAVACAALLDVLSLGGAVWLVPLLAGGLVIAWKREREQPQKPIRAIVGFLALGAVLALPALVAAGSFLRADNQSTFTKSGDLGNLVRPLPLIQAFGIWPSGDFRVDPTLKTQTYLLIGVAALAGLGALAIAWQRRAWGIPLFVFAATSAGGLLFGLGSPWVGAKALATASPAFLAAAVAGGALLFERESRLGGAILAGALALGVLWSNALAYHAAWLAPRPQLAELAKIGKRFAGQGPTLMTEYQPYGVRHFLRDLDAEGASELRVRPVFLRRGSVLGKAEYVDIDQILPASLYVYRTLVLRQSPFESRPPSAYQLVWSGRYYTVWQRPDPPRPGLIDHLPLGDPQTGAVPRCSEVLRLAREATRSHGDLEAALPGQAVVVPLSEIPRPPTWVAAAPSNPSIILPTAGSAAFDIRAPVPGRYQIWLGGSFHARVAVRVDGRTAGSARAQLQNTDQFSLLGTVTLRRGTHRVVLSYAGADWRPGSAGFRFPIGPLVFSRSALGRSLVTVKPKDARTLCGRPLDWVEAIY